MTAMSLRRSPVLPLRLTANPSATGNKYSANDVQFFNRTQVISHLLDAGSADASISYTADQTAISSTDRLPQ